MISLNTYNKKKFKNTGKAELLAKMVTKNKLNDGPPGTFTNTVPAYLAKQIEKKYCGPKEGNIRLL